MARLTTLAPRLSSSTPSRVTVPEKRAEPFYLSPEWRELRAYIVKRAGGICECGCGCPIHGWTYVDHIREIKDGGALLDPMNLQALRADCHNRKTAVERRRRHSERFTSVGSD